MKRTIITILIALGIVVLLQDFFMNKKKNTAITPREYVVMLSLDGFRWDYQDKTKTPNLDYITKNGVKAEGLQPSFPSKTFPNHYTIVTGLYPGNHGLISNSFYAVDINDYYSMQDRSKVENGKFYKGEPIWVTAEAQRLKTASYFWVGSEAKIKGYQPTYWKKDDHHFPYEQRIDSLIHWLGKPFGERPHLVTWYLDQADGVGHGFGPDSPEIKNSIQYLDSMIGVFLTKMEQLEIKDSVNFIVISDHGMGPLTAEKTVYLKHHMNFNWIDTAFGNNPFVLMHSKKGCTDSIFNALKDIKGITVWKKKDIPERFHFKQNERVSDIVIVADSGWSVSYINNGIPYTGGTHGYDNTNKDMYGIFYGIGPSFKSEYNAGTLYNVDIYNLIAHILEIEPAKNDGNPEKIFHVLKE